MRFWRLFISRLQHGWRRTLRNGGESVAWCVSRRKVTGKDTCTSEAEEGLSNNQLKVAFRAIMEISGKASANQQCPINKNYGQPCASKEETLPRVQGGKSTIQRC